MKLPRYFVLLFLCCAPLCSQAETSAALKSLAWKKFAQDLSNDPFFQADIKKVLPGLTTEGKAAVTKCIGQMINGKGVMKTDTVADAIISKELRGKASSFLPAEEATILDGIPDAELLAIASGIDPAARAGELLQPGIVEIVLDSDPEKKLEAKKGNQVSATKQASRIRLQPGLMDPKLVSMELASSKGCFIRHSWAKVMLHERPPAGDGERAGFDADASFKVIVLAGDKVQFEACNYPGRFVTLAPDGSCITEKEPDPARATFRLIRK